MAILIHRKCDIRVLEVFRLDSCKGRFLALKVKVQNETMLLANIYAPNKDDPDFFREVFDLIDKIGVDRKIIGGDFNLVMDNSIDRTGRGPHKHQKAMEKINNLVEIMDLTDIWRFIKVEDPGFT